MEKISWLWAFIIFLLPVAGCGQMFPPPDKEAPALNTVTHKIEPLKSLSERKLNGPVLMYYDNGQPKAKRVYKDAKLNGIYRAYYDNGQVKVEGTYKDDKMDGVFRQYDRNGQLQVEETYRENIPVNRKVLNNNS